jgi:PhnB protein
MKINPHLSFNGDCEAAFQFYEKALGGKIQFLMTWADSPMAANVPADWQKKIMHASFVVGDQSFAGADAPPGRYEKPQGMYVALAIDTPEEADRVFKALSQNGKVQMEIQETFWAKRFGMAIDQYGTPWMINCSNNRRSNSSG